jgi:serine/threonine protein kinase
MNKFTPQKLGNYDIIERLGHGGMAEVYKGHHPTLERFVAIKVLHRHLSDTQDLIERFKLEARAIAKLQHPHIMRLIDFDAQADEFYMVLEYLEGGNFKAYLKQQGRFSPEEALRLAAQLLSGLDYAHQHGMIHRDIKSANVLFMDDSHSHAVLADFGLARILDETGLTVSGTMLGTPSYMSPEAARGERLDERADIYSFGIVLYEMLTGTTPYTADTPYAVLLMHIQEPLPSPRQFNANLPVVVEEILFKALAKKLEERFQSAREFGVAIEKALQQLNPSNNIAHHSPIPPLAKGGKGDGARGRKSNDNGGEAVYPLRPPAVTPSTRVWAGSEDKEEPSITISIPRRRIRLIAAVGLSFIIGAILMMVILFAFDGKEREDRENHLNPSPMIEEESREQESSTDIPPNLFDETNPDRTVLLYSNLASPQQIESPTVGQGGMTEQDNTSFAAETSYAPSLWKADEWVHIRARWDSKAGRNALQLFVNDKHVNETSSQGGWNIKSKPEDRENLNIFVGSGTACGDFIADGIIDDILIRDKAERIN